MGENPQIATSVVKEDEEITVDPRIEGIDTSAGEVQDEQLPNARHGDDEADSIADSIAELKAYEQKSEDQPSNSSSDAPTASPSINKPFQHLATATKSMFRPFKKGSIEGNVEHGETQAVERADTLRVHGIYMGDRRHFSIRLVEGKMELFDVIKAQVIR